MDDLEKSLSVTKSIVLNVKTKLYTGENYVILSKFMKSVGDVSVPSCLWSMTSLVSGEAELGSMDGLYFLESWYSSSCIFIGLRAKISKRVSNQSHNDSQTTAVVNKPCLESCRGL